MTLPVYCSCLGRREVKLLNEENPAQERINQTNSLYKKAITIFRSLFLMQYEISALRKLMNLYIYIKNVYTHTLRRYSEVRKPEMWSQKTLFATFFGDKIYTMHYDFITCRTWTYGLSMHLYVCLETGCKRNVTGHVGLKCVSAVPCV